MSTSYAVLPVKFKAGQKFHSAQSCLYSNQIEPLSFPGLGAERCSFVSVGVAQLPGIYSRDQLMAVRLLPKHWAAAFKSNTLESKALEILIAEELTALRRRKTALLGDEAQALRWVHGDADGIPGIVIDDYGPLVVMQSGSPVGDFILPLVTQALMTLVDKPIFERSSGQIRALEKLPERTRWIRPANSQHGGESMELVKTNLAGLQMSFRPMRCQKTGLFLDQRENLTLFGKILTASHASSMLDLCSYAGAWSCAGAQVGVREFTVVDQDKDALELCTKNISDNSKDPNKIQITQMHGDLFELLSKLNKEKRSFSAVVADPPAFTKSAKHVPEARRAYQRLSKLASRLVAVNGIYVACSCSRHIDEEEFYEIVSNALESDDWIYLGRGRQSPDHTVLTTDKHSLYLKALYFMRRSSLAQFAQNKQNQGES